jgi:hypothetical protein
MRLAAANADLRFVLALALVAGCSGNPSASTSGAPPVPSPTPPDVLGTVAPTATENPNLPAASATTNAGWEPVPAQPSVQGAQFSAVEWTGARFLAIADGRVVSSDDALIWHTQGRQVGSTASLIAAGPQGVVVVGWIDDRQTSWFSAEGSSWTAGRDAFPMPALGDDSVAINDVVATDMGWLAVGTREGPCFTNCGTDPLRGYVWLSDDGLAWTRVPDQGSLKGGGINSVASVPGVGLVAVGVASGRVAIWTSPEGTAWSRVADASIPNDPFDGVDRANAATGVAARDGMIVVVGQAFGQDACPIDAGPGSCGGARAWRSADGVTWKAATVELARDSQMFGVATTLHRFLAFGPSGEPGCSGGVWSSTDGVAWRCEASDEPAWAKFGPYAAAGSDSLEVAVGLTSDGWDEESDEGMPGSVWRRAQQ